MPSASANGWWNVNAAANATPVSAATPIRRTKPGRRSATRIPGTAVPSVWCGVRALVDRDEERDRQDRESGSPGEHPVPAGRPGDPLRKRRRDRVREHEARAVVADDPAQVLGRRQVRGQGLGRDEEEDERHAVHQPQREQERARARRPRESRHRSASSSAAPANAKGRRPCWSIQAPANGASPTVMNQVADAYSPISAGFACSSSSRYFGKQEERRVREAVADDRGEQRRELAAVAGMRVRIRVRNGGGRLDQGAAL